MKKKILIFDTNPAFLKELERTLSDEGYRVEAFSGSDIIKGKLETFRPDLLIMEISLDGRDARLICNEIKSAEYASGISIMLLTSLTHRQIAEIECDADAILAKSQPFPVLLRTIKDFTV
ncbi:response regulator [Pedobacter mucosus]|uniref:response regulator n=1 Tax=Pedobacter mucosus TaxID=2895286 RepID=UPI001EE43690|nr:response regulator [Pedobacter mucosus]UKT65011.1 response regulator [Pedobacter mucosus]